jgi:hypothetical protein
MRDTTTFVQPSLYQLPYLGEPELRLLLGRLHPFLWPVIITPWEDFLRRRSEDRDFADMDEDEVAVWLTMRAGKTARRIFDGKPDVRVETFYKKPVLLVCDQVAITVKKLTRRPIRPGGELVLTRSSYLTQRNMGIWNQEQVHAFPDIPRVILGYEFLEEMTAIKLWVAYPRTRDKGVAWAYLLEAPVAAPVEFPDLRIFAGELVATEESGFVIERVVEEKEVGNDEG